LFAKRCSSIRKVIGIGSFAEHLVAAIAVCSPSRDSNNDHILQVLSTCHHLGYAIFLTSDIVLYLKSLDLIRSSFAAGYEYQARKAWFYALVCSIARGWYRLGMVSTEKDLTTMPNEKMTRTNIWAQLVSDYCDLSMASTLLGYTKHSDGFVAINGTISSLIGIWKVLQKTA
jgi:peroxin-11B